MFQVRGSITTLACVAALGLAACSTAAPEQTPETFQISTGLSVTRAPGSLTGTYRTAVGSIDFASVATGVGARLVLTVNDKPFDVELDLVGETLAMDGHDAVLTAADRDTLRAFALELGPWLVANDGQPHELLAAVDAEYWATAPEGHVHAARFVRADIRDITDAEAAGERPARKSNGGDGITCIRKGSTYTAYYDLGTNGTVYSKNVTCNSNWGTNACGGGDYSCMGRCGGGCGWGAPSSYTLDCLDHDTCSHDRCGNGGSGDSNCGDEYNNAADDWSFGVAWGCNGN